MNCLDIVNHLSAIYSRYLCFIIPSYLLMSFELMKKNDK